MAALGLTCARKPPACSRATRHPKCAALLRRALGQPTSIWAALPLPPRPPHAMSSPGQPTRHPLPQNVKKTKADCTLRSSQAVPHPSTNRALRRLTSEVGRDLVYSARYGRQRSMCKKPRFPEPCLPAPTYIYHVCICTYVCLCIYICLHAYVHLRAYQMYPLVYVYIHIHVCMCVCIPSYMYVYSHICICIHMNIIIHEGICVCMYVCMYIYIYI